MHQQINFPVKLFGTKVVEMCSYCTEFKEKTVIVMYVKNKHCSILRGKNTLS